MRWGKVIVNGEFVTTTGLFIVGAGQGDKREHLKIDDHTGGDFF